MTCEGVFVPSSEFVGAERFEVILETDTSAYDVNYGVDSLSFVAAVGALDIRNPPKPVESLWNSGAEWQNKHAISHGTSAGNESQKFPA